MNEYTGIDNFSVTQVWVFFFLFNLFIAETCARLSRSKKLEKKLTLNAYIILLLSGTLLFIVVTVGFIVKKVMR